MPVIKSAIKKLRQDKRRTKINDKTRLRLEVALSNAANSKKFESVSEAHSQLDKAAKKGILHPNKAARMKSRISKNAKPQKISTSASSAPKTKRVKKSV